VDPALPGRLAGYLGLFGLLGAPTGLALIRRAARERTGNVPRGVESRARSIVLAAAALWVAGCAWRFAFQTAALADPGTVPGLELFRAVLLSDWGNRWRWQLAAGVLATLAGAWFERPAAPAALLGLTAAATLPLTGHALEYRGGSALGWLLQTMHLTAAGLWLGTLGVLVVLLPEYLHGVPAEIRRSTLVAVAAGFSRLALAAAVVVSLAGALLAIADVGSWVALVDGEYGRILLLKLASVAAILGLGAWNWRRAVPRLRDALAPDAERRLAATAGLELGMTLIVLALTAALGATEAPGIR
jgi:copper transport protein